jgi:hypothetical protein
VLVIVGVLGLAVTVCQFYYGLRIAVAVADPIAGNSWQLITPTKRDVPHDDPSSSAISTRIITPTKRAAEAAHDPNYFKTILPLPRNETFGACLMLKEDNDLLWEWLAYHYTVLPLRYLLVGSDLGNMQNPDMVLKRWIKARTGLEYWIINATQFIYRFGAFRGPKDDKDFAHHFFIHRQRGFVTTCTEFFRSINISWVTFIDSDEFVVMNRIGTGVIVDDSEEEYRRDSKNSTSQYQPRYQLRQALPPPTSSLTIRQVIDERLRPIGFTDVCYVMPRLLYGSLENRTCPEAKEVNDLARQSFNFSEMSTLRFVQTARKGDFSTGKFGKVFVDVSRLPEQTVLKEPNNVHRPFMTECKRPVAHFPSSAFYLNHYVGSWERYSSRSDARRSRKAWEPRAYKKQTGLVCDKAVHEWLPRFVQQVGLKRAQYLLGVRNDNDNNEHHIL